MIRIVVTGSECTGKTTLASELAKHYGTNFVAEFARRFVAAKSAPPEYADVELIARGQIELEDELAARSPTPLILDTDLLSTLVYSRHYYGDCPAWIRTALHARAGQLYLLADIDVPWAPDGQQRDRGERREEMRGLFRQALIDHELPHLGVRGAVDERLQTAVAAIDPLL